MKRENGPRGEYFLRCFALRVGEEGAAVDHQKQPAKFSYKTHAEHQTAFLGHLYHVKIFHDSLLWNFLPHVGFVEERRTRTSPISPTLSTSTISSRTRDASH
jgi:hypothetical protein